MNNLKTITKYFAKGYSPDGKSDKGGRWYPSNDEMCDCCNKIRGPSRAFPWSLWKHCKSNKHVENWILKHQDSDTLEIKEASAMTLETAPKYIDLPNGLLAFVRDDILGYHQESHRVPKVDLEVLSLSQA